MKKYIIIALVLFSSVALAEIGVVNRIIGTDALVIRENQNLPVVREMELEEGDRIETNNSVVLLHLYPGTQINLSEHSVFSIEEHEVELDQKNETSSIVMNFLKGKLRILVEKLNSEDSTSQIIKTNSVALGVRGTQFEVEATENETAVDVTEGKVEATTNGDSVLLKKDESLQIPIGTTGASSATHLAQKIHKGQKYINHTWSFQFEDSEKIRQKWKERRTIQRNALFKIDPEKRKQMHELRMAKRNERRKKWLTKMSARNRHQDILNSNTNKSPKDEMRGHRKRRNRR